MTNWFTFHVRIKKLNYLVLCLKTFCARVLNQSSIIIKENNENRLFSNYLENFLVKSEVNENNC